MLLKLNERMLPAVSLICSTPIMKKLVSNPCVLEHVMSRAGQYYNIIVNRNIKCHNNRYRRVS